MVRNGALIADKIAMLERKALVNRPRSLLPASASASAPAPVPVLTRTAMAASTSSPQKNKCKEEPMTGSGSDSSASGTDSGSETGSLSVSCHSQEGSSPETPERPGADRSSLSGSSSEESSPSSETGSSDHEQEATRSAPLPPEPAATSVSASASAGCPGLAPGSDFPWLARRPPQAPQPQPQPQLHKLTRDSGRLNHAKKHVHSSHESLLRRRPAEQLTPVSIQAGSLDRRERRKARQAKARSAVVELTDPLLFGRYSSSQVNLSDWWVPSLGPGIGLGPGARCYTSTCGQHHCCPPPLPPPCCCSSRHSRHSRHRSRREHADSGKSSDSAEERTRRLQADNEHLQLQAAVLSERIDVQVDKMAELEAALVERKRALQQAEDQLQREMLTRSSLETQKLELLSSVTELKRQLVALSRENAELREMRERPPGTGTGQHKPPVPAQRVYFPTALLRDASPAPASPMHRVGTGTGPPALEHAESYREIRELTRDIPPPRTPPATYRQRVHQYHSLPRDSQADGSYLPGAEIPAQTTAITNGTSNNISSKKGVAFADAERVVIQDETDRSLGLSPHASPSLSLTKTKGLKKILGRMKRSGSGNLEDLGEGDFRRGGVRATAGARLGWSTSSNALSVKLQQPFPQWDRDAVSEWLCSLGLEHCAQEGRGWIVSGAQLLAASTHDLEKELAIKNPLHRKKLRLALQEKTDSGLAADPQLCRAGALDTTWVLRWLDDTGLPQLKEQFGAARVDGRMLHRLTMDDLAALHVTSLLHVASLRTGIQVLRDHSFEPDCLVRRSAPTEGLENGLDRNEEDNLEAQREVALWTTHRVMEWLRVVDLAEYAPNLRGSGVHGGLMVHEPRFTAELLASLLSIPPSKTLLRRHLNTHFKELLGKNVIQLKRQAEGTLGYTPLTPTAKIKVPKKSQFSLKRQKTKCEVEFGDLVCPLENSLVPVPDPELNSGDRGSGDGRADLRKPSAASPESDESSIAEDSHSGRTSTV